MLTALLLAAPVISATAVGDAVVPNSNADARGWRVVPATIVVGAGSQRSAASSHVRPYPLPAPAPTPTPSPVTATPPPLTPPPPTPTPEPPPPPANLCPDALSLNVVDAELAAQVQAGADLLAAYFGCQKFRLDGTGLPIKFAQITPMLNARVLGYAYSAPDVYEIWINPDCWGVVEDWAGVVAHELGHYLGWQHGDDHPYMWLAPPPGSYAQADDARIVC